MSITEISVPGFRTSDGKTFDILSDALSYEARINMEKPVRAYVGTLEFTDRHKNSIIRTILSWEEHKAQERDLSSETKLKSA